MLVIFLDFGLDFISVRDISVQNNKLSSFFNAVFFYRVSLFILFSVGITLYFFFFDGLNSPLFLPLMFLLTFQVAVVLLQFIRSLISAFQNFPLFSGLLIFEKLLLVVLGFITLVLYDKLIYFLFALALGNIISLFVFVYLLKKKYKLKFKVPLKKDIKYLLINALPLLLMSIFVLAYFRIDVLILDWLIGNKTIVGIYGSIHRIIEMYFLIPSVLMSTAFPIISKNFSEDPSYVISLVKKLLNVISAVSIPIAVLIAFNSYDLNLLIFGNEYKTGYSGLIFLIWTILPLGYNYVLGHVLISIDKQKYCAISLAVASVINIILNLILIPKFSFAGTCIALLITEIIIFIFNSYYAERFLGDIKIMVISIKVLSIIIITFAFYFFVSTLFHYNLFSGITLFACLSFILVYKFNFISNFPFNRIWGSLKR